MPSGQFNKRFKAEASQMLFRKRKYKYAKRRYRGSLVPFPETKYFDFGLPGLTNLPATGATTLGSDVTTVPYWPTAAGPTAIGTCFAPILGNDINNRIGRKCSVKKIRVNGHIYVPTQVAQADSDTPVIVRAVLFVDKQANSTQPHLNDVFQTNTALTNAFSSINVPQNLATLGRFRVLKDKKIKLAGYQLTGAPPAVVQGGLVVPFKFHVKFKKPLIVHFNATNAGKFSDIVENSININFVANNTACVPQVQYYGRVSYSDV